MRRIVEIATGLADLFWTLEDRYPLTLRVTGALLLLVALCMVLGSFGWLLSALYIIPIIAGIGGGVLVAMLAQYSDEGSDDLEDWFWLVVCAVIGGLAGLGVSALIAWGFS